MSDMVPVSVNKNAAVSRGGLEVRTLGDVIQAASLIHKAGWAPKNMTSEQCAVAAMHGMEAGLPLCFSIQNIAVINGRPSMFGDAIMALIHASGQLEEWSETEYRDPRVDPKNTDGMGWKCSMKRVGNAQALTGTYTVADAKRAGLWGRQGPWSTNPGRMLRIRARCFVARDLFADVLRGMTFREEAEDLPPPAEREPDYQVIEPRLEDAFMRPEPKDSAPASAADQAPRMRPRSRTKRPPAEPTPPPAPASFQPQDIPSLEEDAEAGEGFGATPFEQAEPLVDLQPPAAPPPAPKTESTVEKFASRFAATKQGSILPQDDDNPAWLKEDIGELVVECNKANKATVMPRFLDRMSVEELKSLRDTLRKRLQG